MARYLLRPKADRDLDDQADHLADVATVEVGHRFLNQLRSTDQPDKISRWVGCSGLR